MKILNLYTVLFFSALSLFISPGALGFKKIDRPIKQVGILLATSKGLGQSSFGHAFLRLSPNEIWSDEDITVEFVADNQMQSIDIWKGMGLTGNYNFAINFGTYRATKYYSNVFEDRDLVTYPIKMNADQTADLVKLLNGLPDKISQEQYSFFSKNCAYQVSKVLTEVLKTDPKSGFNIPTLLDSKFNDIIDFNDIQVDEAASTKRNRLVEKKFPQALKSYYSLAFQNLETQLKSLIYKERLLAIFKLINFHDFANLDSNLDNEIRIFLNLYLLLEDRSTSSQILKSLDKNGTYQFRLVSIDKDLASLEVASPISKLIASNLISKNGAFLNFKVTNTTHSTEQDTTMDLQVNLKPYGIISNKGSLFYENTHLAVSPSTNLFNSESIQTNGLVLSEVVTESGKSYLLPYLLIETQTTDLTETYAQISQNEIIPIRNFSFNGQGQCINFILIEKKLNEQVIFFPEQKRLDLDKNLELFKKVLSGKVVFIPGFKHTWDWLESFGEDNLKNAIAEFGLSLGTNSFLKLAQKYFSRIQITEKNIQDLDLSFSRGVTVPVRFKVEGQRAEHALLVYEIVDKGDYYSLGFYDPNIGLISASSSTGKVLLNKKSGLIYSDLYAKNGTELYADIMDLRSSLNFKAIQKRPDLQKFFNIGQSLGKYDFSISELNN